MSFLISVIILNLHSQQNITFCSTLLPPLSISTGKVSLTVFLPGIKGSNPAKYK